MVGSDYSPTSYKWFCNKPLEAPELQSWDPVLPGNKLFKRFSTRTILVINFGLTQDIVRASSR